MFGIGGFHDMMGGMGAGAAAGMGAFEEQYHCYPVSFQDKEHMEDGDKILLPSSALDSLARLQIEYPMLFELSNPAEGKRTHCGVLEFSAPEGSCYIPYWMMQNLLLEAGALLTVKNKSLPKATFVKFQPQSVDFLDISNPRAVLERQLRQYSCVTQGDIICIPYNSKKYYLEVKEVKPAEAACIIETDCNVDFDAPIGYTEHKMNGNGAAASSGGGSGRSSPLPLPAPQLAKAAPAQEPEKPAFVPFAGSGARLDGKPAAPSSAGTAAAGGAAGASGGRAAALAAAEARAAAAREAASAAAGAGAADNGAAAAVQPVAHVRRGSGGKYARRASSGVASAFQGSGNTLS